VRQRLLVAVMGLGLSVPLTVASRLEPNRQGQGTHQRLGLPPCSFRVVSGQRCPVCGMTTSWAHLVRGELIEALRANVGGTLLGMVAMVAVPWLLLSAARGRWLGWTPNSAAAAWIATSIMLVTLIDWSVRLMSG